MYPHRIRLRGPWECDALGRVVLPGGLHEGPFKDFSGEVLLRRRFGRPRQLDPFERIWLTVQGVPADFQVTLNGQVLTMQPAEDNVLECDVTAYIRPRNELELELNPTQVGQLEIALEMRCLAYLRHVHAEFLPSRQLRVNGEVVGTFEQPLDLYILVANRTAGYCTVNAALEGSAFELLTEAQSENAALEGGICVELVNGGVVWWTWEQQLT